jgi:hypothetical protein
MSQHDAARTRKTMRRLSRSAQSIQPAVVVQQSTAPIAMIARSSSANFNTSRTKMRKLQARVAPLTAQLQATFKLRRILLESEQCSDEEIRHVMKHLSERTTLHREQIWALLSPLERMRLCSSLRLVTVDPSEEAHDIVISNSWSGSMFVMIEGVAEVQQLDTDGIVPTIAFEANETFGLVSIPSDLEAAAASAVKVITSDRHSKAFRGSSNYDGRRHQCTEVNKLRVSFKPNSSYIAISNASVAAKLHQLSERLYKRKVLKGLGFDIAGLGMLDVAAEPTEDESSGKVASRRQLQRETILQVTIVLACACGYFGMCVCKSIAVRRSMSSHPQSISLHWHYCFTILNIASTGEALWYWTCAGC